MPPSTECSGKVPTVGRRRSQRTHGTDHKQKGGRVDILLEVELSRSPPFCCSDTIGRVTVSSTPLPLLLLPLSLSYDEKRRRKTG